MASRTNSLSSVGALVAVAAVAGLVVALSERISRDRIAENRQQQLLATLQQVIDGDRYDNDLIGSRVQLEHPLLRQSGPVDLFTATQDGVPVAVVLTPEAADGYNGPIRLLLGIHFDGSLSGVRVLEHRETPGLGDGIERLQWVEPFQGASLRNPSIEDWGIRQDGGAFDQLTGATVTPRAVVNAVKNALIYFEQHREELERQAMQQDAGGGSS